MDDLLKQVQPVLARLADDSENQVPTDPSIGRLPNGLLEIAGQIIESIALPESPEAPIGQVVDSENVQAAKDAFAVSGLDLLAFYKSFRFVEQAPFRGKWGIFLLDVGIEALAEVLSGGLLVDTLGQREARRLARDALLAHEQYHFWIDIWALGQESLQSEGKKRYEYYQRWRSLTELTEADVEESLANNYAFRRLKDQKLSDGSRAEHALRHAFDASPIPYSIYDFSTDERNEREGVLAYAVSRGQSPALSWSINKLGGFNPRLISPAIQAYGLNARTSHRDRCPIHLVRVTNYASAVAPFQGPRRDELKLFIEAYLAGKQEPTTDHEYYRIDNGEKVRFPNPHEKEIRANEFRNVLLKPVMTPKEYRDARAATRNWARACPREKALPPRVNS
jgi:hypothetical protein